MKSTGGRTTAATANGAAVRPSRQSKHGRSADDHDSQEAASDKPECPRGQPLQEAWEAPAPVAKDGLMANGTAERQQMSPGKASSPSHAAARRKPKQPSHQQQASVRQPRQQDSGKQRGTERQPAAAVAGDLQVQRNRRKRKRPARFNSDDSVDEEADDEQEDDSSGEGCTDEETDAAASGQAADGSANSSGGSADEASSSGNSTSSKSSSDSEPQQQTETKGAARKQPAAARRRGDAKQRAAGRGSRQGRAAQAEARSNRQRQKGPLARVKAADVGPGSSNTTTTVSTQLLGGAARPIPEVTSYHQAVRRVNHQIQRISTEEHLLQTYTADGWKGASKEKVRLTDDLKRAEQTLARCKESIRQACRFCEEVHPGPPIPASSFDSDGEVDVTDIFCAKCQKQESSDDNDLVLCDGPCNRAYHECCLTPRLVAADIPEDEGWLCPACDAKLDIMIQINDYYNTEYTIETSWQQLFSESPEEQEALQLQRLRSGELLSPRAGRGAAAAAAAGWLAHEFPSTDEEDNSYSESDHDEVEGKHRPQQLQQQLSSHKARKRAAAAVNHRSSDASSSDGDGSSDGSGSSSCEDEAVSLHTEDGAQLSEPEDDQQLRRSKRRSALDSVAAAAIAAGASPRNTTQKEQKGRVPGRHQATAAAAAAQNGGSGKPVAKRRKSTGAGSAAGGLYESESADEQQQQKRQKRLQSSGSSRRRRRRTAVDYKQLHEQLFGFTAFEGDDDVFKEDDDDDYETDSPSEASD